MPVSVVVLAAGQGKRMHSARPKVLQSLAGQPLLEHVLATARSLNPAGIHVVYGHGGDQVVAAFEAQTDLKWAHQAEQLGTGHAVMQAMPAIPDDHTVLVLCGDVPLVGTDVVQKLVADSAERRARAAHGDRSRPRRLRPRAARLARRRAAHRRAQGRERRRAARQRDQHRAHRVQRRRIAPRLEQARRTPMPSASTI